MIIGVPKEIKDNEYRVAVTPSGCEMLVAVGHHVLVERRAGVGSGFSDEEYDQAGAKLIDTAAEVFVRSDLIVKVKEPLPQEYDLLKEESNLFTFLHLAAVPELTAVLVQRRVTGIAYETVQLADGSLPLLNPMSQIAGRMAVQVAAHYLEKTHGGSGRLLGGIPGVQPCHVVILGSGAVSTNAAQMALGMAARVTMIARNIDRLCYLSETLHGNLVTLSLNPQNLRGAVKDADLVISGILVLGARAPILVTRDMIRTMRPGSVIVDVSVDQGGCVETCHPTSHSDPIYVVDGVIHYCVANMPGAVPHTSTVGLTNVTLPYVLKLASEGIPEAFEKDSTLAKGVNTYKGCVTCPGVAEACSFNYVPLGSIL